MADSRGSGAPDKVQEALTEVVKALGPLSPDDRERILTSAAAFYGAPKPRQEPKEEEEGVRPGTNKSGRAPSLREFLNDVKPKTTPQKLATFAYYREHHESTSTFARADLLAYFAQAKEREPKNYHRDFAKAVREGWIHEKGSASYLTGTGSQAVEAHFEQTPKARASSQKKPK